MNNKIYTYNYVPNGSGIYCLVDLKTETIIFIGATLKFSGALSSLKHSLKNNKFLGTRRNIIQEAYNNKKLMFYVIEQIPKENVDLMQVNYEMYVALNKNTVCNYFKRTTMFSSNGNPDTHDKRHKNALGANNPNCKFSEEKVTEILWLKEHTNLSFTKIAEMYDTTQPNVSRIGVSAWLHLSPKKPKWFKDREVKKRTKKKPTILLESSNKIEISFIDNTLTVSSIPNPKVGA